MNVFALIHHVRVHQGTFMLSEQNKDVLVLCEVRVVQRHC